MKMKKVNFWSLALMATALLTACDKKEEATAEEAAGNFEVEYFAFQQEEDGPWGLMDTEGNVLVKPKYDGETSAVVGGAFYVSNSDYERTLYTAGKKPKKIGHFKDCGSFTSELCPVMDFDENLKYINKQGDVVIDLAEMNGKTVTAAFNFYCGLALVCLEYNKWGFIDEEGNDVIPCKFADAWHFSDDVALVYLQNPTYEENDNGKWCVIDKEGKKLFTKRFSDIKPSEYMYRDGLLEVTDSDGKYQVIDKEGNMVYKCNEGDFTMNIYNGMFCVYNHDTEKRGLMNADNEWVMKQKYDAIEFNGKLIAAKQNDRWAIYNTDAEKTGTLPAGIETVNLFESHYKNSDNVFLAGSWDEGYALYNSEGKKIKTDAKIRYFSKDFSWGIMQGGEEEYYEDYEEDGDYEE